MESQETRDESNCIRYQISKDVVLRPECFGGIVFQKNSGTIMEMDAEAFAVLEYIKYQGEITKNDLNRYLAFNRIKPSLAYRTIQAFSRAEIISHRHVSIDSIQLKRKIENKNGPQKRRYQNQNLDTISHALSAPETVHWAITYRCNEHCPDCYVGRYSKNFPTELSSFNAKRVIIRLADWGVLQVAIGGGEPLLRPDIVELTHYTKMMGLMVHLTTGMQVISPELMNALSVNLSSIQFGLRIKDCQQKLSGELQRISILIKNAMRSKLYTGVNVILSKSIIQNLESIVLSLLHIGVERIIFLRYKPPADELRWEAENPPGDLLLSVPGRLKKMEHNLKGIDIRLDCALSFLQPRLPYYVARSFGLQGCTAANRVVAMTPDGFLFPCSQLIDSRWKSGNIFENDLKHAWKTNPVLQKIRAFRDQPTFQKGPCGTCGMVSQCGGCRIFAPDLLSSDLECPCISSRLDKTLN